MAPREGFVSRSRWVVLLLAIAAAVLVLQSGDPTGSSWPVLFLVLFGMALMARALWRMISFAAHAFDDAR